MSEAFAETDLVGESMPMRRLRDLVSTIAPTRVPVLIEGPTGSGKELVAALVHHRSRRLGKLVAFNVCALGDSIFEDALFGHVRGAYTGAVQDSLGLLREADRGSAFFDEIGGLPLASQAKLLRAIETGEFRPIGGRMDVRSDFRLIAATNEGLDVLVERGRFRADLRHRLGGVTIRVPSLRERLEDIPLLAHHFARRAAGADVYLETTAEALLMSTPWSGNVRELKQVIDVAVAFDRHRLTRGSIAAALDHRSVTRFDVATSSDDRRELVDALEDAAWNVDDAAARLGIHRATIYRRMKRHGIEVPRVAPSRATMRREVATDATEVAFG